MDKELLLRIQAIICCIYADDNDIKFVPLNMSRKKFPVNLHKLKEEIGELL